MATKTDRIRIEYNLTFETLFHCGTGIREGLMDRTMIRDQDGFLYVPGSTFKGVLREHCEQLARFYAENDEDKRSIASPHDEKAALQEFGHNRPTMITRIFGSQISPGILFFDDARQDEDSLHQYDGSGSDDKGKYRNQLQMTPYTQVRLDRPTRTAVAGALYTSEFGNRDIVFKGIIQGWLACTVIEPGIHPVFEQAQREGLAPTYSLLLLLAGLRMVQRLGGNKSTGKGKCLCKITTVNLNGTEISEKTWPGWLEQLDALTYYNTSLEG